MTPEIAAVTYREHDCHAPLQTHFHNNAEANWRTCGRCGKITAFRWKSLLRRIRGVFSRP